MNKISSIELHFIDHVRTLRNSVLLKVGNDTIFVNYNDEHERLSLEGNLNAKTKVKSLSMSLLNDLSIMQEKGIAYKPYLMDDEITKAKKEMDEFFSDAFQRLLTLNAYVAPLIEATEKERAELMEEKKARAGTFRRRSFSM